MKRLFLIILPFLVHNVLLADIIGYDSKVMIEIESVHYKVIHYHDWSDSTRDERYKMISTTLDPFTSENNYAYIQCINRQTGEVLFKKPCPALTILEISPDEKYIVGLSNIKLWNPYQLVIYDINGNLIKKRGVSREEAKMDINELNLFKIEYPNQYEYLDSTSHIYKVSDDYYIDFMCIGMPGKIGGAFKFLLKFNVNNHLSNHFGESVTNWIYWYNQDSLKIRYQYDKKLLTAISLLDLRGDRFSVKINE